MTDSKAIEKIIGAHPFFSLLSPEELTLFSKHFQEIQLNTGATLTQEGQILDSIFLILTGNADAKRQSISKNHVGEIKIATFGPGETIGLMETGLFSGTGLRTATVTAITPMTVLKMGIHELNSFMQHQAKLYTQFKKSTERILKMHFIKQLTPFNSFSNQAIAHLMDDMETLILPAQQVIFHEGDVGKACYVIEKGEVDILKHAGHPNNLERVCTLTTNAFFGEVTLLTNAIYRNATAIAKTDCQLLCISKKSLLATLEKEHAAKHVFGEFVNLNCVPQKNPATTLIQSLTSEQTPITILENTKTHEKLYLSALELELWHAMDSKHSLHQLLRQFSKSFAKNESESLKNFLLKLIELHFIVANSVPLVIKREGFLKKLARFLKFKRRKGP